jgi:hypothetical protein
MGAAADFDGAGEWLGLIGTRCGRGLGKDCYRAFRAFTAYRDRA